MSAIEVEALLTELAGGEPCGENLEYDPVFVALERDIQGKPESQYGDTVIAAEPPDWKGIKKAALDLSGRTRDLRVAMYLVRALLNVDGVDGFADALAVTDGLLEKYWDGVHPQLDPDDDNDPTLRVNCISTLCSSDTIVREFREAALVASRVHGRFSLRDIEVASGEVPPGKDGVKPDPAAIEAAFMDIDLAQLQATGEKLGRAAELVEHIESVLTKKVGAKRAPDLSALTRQIGHACSAINDRLVRRGVTAATDEAPAAAEGVVAADGARPAAAPISGAIASRGDVIRMLDKICEYYARSEPSSPVPILLDRAKRLVPLSFMDIMKDLAPGGLEQIATIRGRSDEE